MDERDMGETPAEGAGDVGIGTGAEGAAKGGTVSRVQHLVHLLPVDWSAIGSLLTPVLDRMDPESDVTQVLVLTGDSAATLAVSDSALRGRTGGRGIFPVTSVKRAARLFAEGAPTAVATSVKDAKSLIAGSALKLDRLRTLVLAWPDETLADADASSALESIMAEIPKETARVVFASGTSPVLESFLERYMRRARRVEERRDEEALPRGVEFIAVGSGGRSVALRTLLDELDPATAVVKVLGSDAAVDAADALDLLGLASHESVKLLPEGEEGDADVVVLYDMPSSRDELAALLQSTQGRVIALVEPREVSALRRMAGNQTHAYAPATGPRRARSRQASLVAELEGRLTTESFDGEVLALEPMLESHDAIEVAAALFRMLADERVRTEVRAVQSAALAPVRAPVAAEQYAAPSLVPDEPSSWTRVFVNVGERDGASPGDLVGAITGEAGVKRDVIGKIDFRESFAIVEIASDAAEQVIERLTGANVRGRRIHAREDRGPDERERPRGDRPARPSGGRPSFGRPAGGPRSFDRGDRNRDRGAPRGSDRSDRGDRAERSDRGDRGRDRTPSRGFERGGGGERTPSRGFERGSGGERTPSRGFERGSGGERDRAPQRFDRPARGFDRGGSDRGGSRPERPAGGRGDAGGRGRDSREGRSSASGGGRSFDRSGRGPDRGDRGRTGSPGGGAGARERDRGYGRTQDDERTEWRLRGERLRRSRATSDDRKPGERGGEEDRNR